MMSLGHNFITVTLQVGIMESVEKEGMKLYAKMEGYTGHVAVDLRQELEDV